MILTLLVMVLMSSLVL